MWQAQHWSAFGVILYAVATGVLAAATVVMAKNTKKALGSWKEQRAFTRRTDLLRRFHDGAWSVVQAADRARLATPRFGADPSNFAEWRRHLKQDIAPTFSQHFNAISKAFVDYELVLAEAQNDWLPNDCKQKGDQFRTDAARVLLAFKQFRDMLIADNPDDVIMDHKNQVDAVLLCGGSDTATGRAALDWFYDSLNGLLASIALVMKDLEI